MLDQDVRERCYQLESEREKKEYLAMKLREEVEEYCRENDTIELVDILEVILSISELDGWTSDRLEFERLRKEKERGAFSKFWVMPIKPSR
ncbi:MAG: hypothetical protein AB2708_20480 [Candidatus Thiodiazotropha taylori]